MLFFCRQFNPWSPKFLLYTVCYLIIVRWGRAARRVFAKTMKDWQETKLFVVMGWVKMCLKRQVTISSSRAQRAKISSSRPQESSKVVGNGERTRIEALLVARFDAENLADERSTSVAQYKTARNKCQRNRDFL